MHLSNQFWEPRLKGNIDKSEHALREADDMMMRESLKPALCGAAKRTEALGFGKRMLLGDK